MLRVLRRQILVLLCSKPVACPARQERPKTVRANGRDDRQTMTTLLQFVRQDMSASGGTVANAMRSQRQMYIYK